MASTRFDSPRPRAGRSTERVVLVVCLVSGLVLAGREIRQMGDSLFGGIAHAVTVAGTEGGAEANHARPSVR